ncbi:MAG: carbohydrate ABC transporter permease [Ignavibacteriaceae bacterium]|nr:carbohydrate ABC transporter permease [Ignavibacteriaceae bacterium]
MSGRILRYTIILFFGAAAAIPFLWLLSTSLKGAEEIFAFPPSFIPDTLNTGNYTGVWESISFGVYTLNSIIVVSVTVLLNLLLASLAGFALARLNFPGKSIFFLLVLAAMMIPKEIIIIPLYSTVLALGLDDTLAGVILPFAVEGFSIFLMRQAFLQIPKEIEEAAIMDGCSLLTLWYRVMLPMTKPAIGTLVIFTFIGTWGDFIWPLVVLKNSENYTLQVGLSYMTGTFVNNYRYVAAGSVLALIPVLVVFLTMQKQFRRGVFAGTGK